MVSKDRSGLEAGRKSSRKLDCWSRVDSAGGDWEQSVKGCQSQDQFVLELPHLTHLPVADYLSFSTLHAIPTQLDVQAFKLPPQSVISIWL